MAAGMDGRPDWTTDCSEKECNGFELVRRADTTDNIIFPVAIRPGETPVPIPNTMVKTRVADGTALETMWESRWLPKLSE